MPQEGAEEWVEAGFEALAKGGVERVRVEVLAQDLGVTKGGFYRRFKDRRALLDAMLDAWATGRVAVIEKQLALGDGEAPAARLASVIKLFAERVNAEGMAIELAIRQWAQSDKAAARAVALVDAARLKATTTLYTAMGLAPNEAEARGVLFYAYIFGQSLLFLDQSPAKRARLIKSCTETLTELS